MNSTPQSDGHIDETLSGESEEGQQLQTPPHGLTQRQLLLSVLNPTSEEPVDFHPIELAAHYLLSGSLNSLHEQFSLLHESQRLLAARLAAIETRLQKVGVAPDDFDIPAVHARVKAVRRKLAECSTSLAKTNTRLDATE